jgi:hypothetical protein
VNLSLGIGYQEYALNLLGVDEVVFTAPAAGQYWLMDNFTYQTAAVPESGTMLLLGTGLLSLGIFGRRKARAKK